MSIFNPKLLFKADKPDNPQKYVGKNIVIPEFLELPGEGRVKISEKKVVIQSICGNKFKPNYFEINGQYLISMLRFYAQINNAKDITEDDFRAFEEMELTAEKLPNEKGIAKDGTVSGG